jgi:hypothetical protein
MKMPLKCGRNRRPTRKRPHVDTVGRRGGTGCQAVGVLSSGVAGSSSSAIASSVSSRSFASTRDEW